MGADAESPESRPEATLWRTTRVHLIVPALCFAALFPNADIRRLFWAAGFPTPFSAALRNFRPHSRAVQRLAVAELLSEASQLAWADGCATGLQTRSRHVCEPASRLNHLARGRPPLMAVRWPRATGLTSYLSGCFRSQAIGAVCSIAGVWRVSASPALARILSRFRRSFCLAFRRLSLGGSLSGCRQSYLAVLALSSNHMPSGQLPFTQARNQPELLNPARSGFSSPLTAQFLLRVH
jgi:hypothetical protein